MPTMTTERATVKVNGKPQRKRPERKLSWQATAVQGVSVLTLRVGKDVDVYVLRRLRADFGQGFQLAKQTPAGDGEVYSVNLDGLEQRCDCKGHERWGHCKHCDAVQYLLTQGKDV